MKPHMQISKTILTRRQGTRLTMSRCVNTAIQRSQVLAEWSTLSVTLHRAAGKEIILTSCIDILNTKITGIHCAVLISIHLAHKFYMSRSFQKIEAFAFLYAIFHDESSSRSETMKVTILLRRVLPFCLTWLAHGALVQRHCACLQPDLSQTGSFFGSGNIPWVIENTTTTDCCADSSLLSHSGVMEPAGSPNEGRCTIAKDTSVVANDAFLFLVCCFEKPIASLQLLDLSLSANCTNK
ncbi:hypothetical protein BD289DRAFT_290182 [Coniella lustricola]|uniref:Uncharacterized protein n=1 Tax=Coniella lustricola TaxID=2025994 RepID=A0A2T3A5D9_9PEZI|nr:hypothetical protein BD289DRAFT_290182 [Coniella lustricola]